MESWRIQQSTSRLGSIESKQSKTIWVLQAKQYNVQYYRSFGVKFAVVKQHRMAVQLSIICKNQLKGGCLYTIQHIHTLL